MVTTKKVKGERREGGLRTEELSHKSVLKGRGFSRAVQDRINAGLWPLRETDVYGLGSL